MFTKKNYQEAVILIEGMHCAMCSGRMQKAFLAEKHVKEAEVDLEQKSARVVYDAEKLTIDDLKKTVAETGFTAL